MTSELDGTFRELGLSQYLDAFVDQGFDTWDTILDIQESDLDALGVKLGHRRKLQRRIANARGIAPSVSLGSSKQNPEDAKREGARSTTGRSESGHEGNGCVVKRKYRRHPKPDENAPERPPSAYVLFSNKMREDLKGHNLTFTEIAKLVGENWQSLPPAEKEAYESQANTAKEKYHRDLVEYKKTPEYRKYAQYLQEFKEKQAKQNQDANKRTKVEPARLRHGSTSSSAATGVTATSSASGSGSLRDSRSSSEQFLGSDAPPSIDTMTANGHLPQLNDDSRSSPRSAPLDMMGGRQTSGRGIPLKDVIGGGSSADNGRQNLPSLSDVLDEDGRPLKDGGIPYTTSGFVPANARRPIPDAPAFGRAPQLRHDESSAGSSGSATSATSASSFGRPPGDGPLPIHALLSGRGAVASPSARGSSTSPTFSPTPSPMEPGKSAVMGPRGYGFQSAPSALQHLKIEQSNGGDVVMTSPGLSPAAPKGSSKDGLDGMSALLRAGEIVGRRNGE